MIGAASEFERAEVVRREWLAPSVNLCGILSARESGVVMEHVSLYLGHDSGPMHLAAAAGVPCVAIFSARQLPGVWFPYGPQHRVIYHDVPCRDCRLDICERYQKRCIASITVSEVIQAVREQVRRMRASGWRSEGTAPLRESQADQS
jgi:ADP-heptose:LPS heptosyltransferase